MNEQISHMETETENKPSELSKLRGTDHEGFRRMIQRAVKRMQWRMKYRPSTSLFAGKTEQ
jgi:beta-galactosidase/beta-glucuronidase